MQRHRKIEQLVWAAARDVGPFGERKRRPRGAKGLGVKYEADLAAALPRAVRGQWFEFLDRNGRGWCQTDLLLRVDDSLVVLEAKHTWTLTGHSQIELLYRPILEKIGKFPVLGIVVCKHLLPEMPVRVARTLDEALVLARRRQPVALHWIGSGRLDYEMRSTTVPVAA
jgi:hypothetical protein